MLIFSQFQLITLLLILTAGDSCEQTVYQLIFQVCQVIIYNLKVFHMKGRKQKRRNDELLMETERSNMQHALPLKISFNLCQDNIACFVGQKKNNKKRSQRLNPSLQKAKTNVSKHQIQMQKQVKKIEVPKRHINSQCEQIIQGSLNSILTEIETKGIDCKWNEYEQQEGKVQQIFDSECDQLWKAFSVNQSFSKSYASTTDFYSHTPLYQPKNYNLQTYYYEYNYKRFDDASLYLVFPEHIQNDLRTTVMIRNIPNKYTINELSNEIDYHFQNTYDFLYLPCDIKNQCNVGYGFINFLNTSYLLQFYQIFQGKKWAKFRSEKICNLTYARLQGLNNLIEHFQNSKVQKDKRYKPIIKLNQIQDLIKSQQIV